MNTPVSFPLAKLLNSIGFKEYCSSGYTKTGDRYFHQSGYVCNGQSYYNGRYYTGGEFYCSAPTIAEVLMWLYEKNGIWISCEPYDVGRFKYIIINGLNLSRKEITGFNSPTEAYEAAIEYTLNNLI